MSLVRPTRSNRPPQTPTRRLVKFAQTQLERLMAILALTNLGLVAFDYSYIPFRDVYLRYVPEFTQWYGATFKGIEPNRTTEAYLARVDELKEQVAQTGLRSPEVSSLLTELRTLSDEMIDEDPFQIANKSGTLEKIKNRMRDFIESTTGEVEESSKQAFALFWSVDYLSEVGWETSTNFFDADIAPLVATNYYRGIGEDGRPTDDFWKIDHFFIILFAIELFWRTLFISRRYKGINWIDAILWRWYDILLLIPFWRWLRVIPVSVRLSQTKLGNSVPLVNRIRRAIVTSFAVELTEIVVIRVLDQVQNLLREGEVSRWLLQPDPARRYVDLNGVDEIAVISKRLTTILTEQILPKIKPDLDALLKHSVSQVLRQAPGYRNIEGLPGMRDWSERVAESLVSSVSENLISAVKQAMQDQTGAKLMQQMVQNFGDTFRTEIQKDNALEEIQALLSVFLDEIKINYVQRIEAEDLEELQEAARQQVYNLIQLDS